MNLSVNARQIKDQLTTSAESQSWTFAFVTYQSFYAELPRSKLYKVGLPSGCEWELTI